MAERTVKIYDKVYVEFCEIGKPAILHIEKDGKSQRIQTSVVEHCVISPSGNSSVITKRSIYRTEK